MRREKRKRAARDAEKSLSETTEQAACELDEDAADEGVCFRLRYAAKRFLEETYPKTYNTQSSGAFVARTATGAWLALHAMRPCHLGTEWPALLRVCIGLAHDAFTGATEVLDRLLDKPPALDRMLTLVTHIGHNFDSPTKAERSLMMSARQLARTNKGLEECARRIFGEISKDRRMRVVVNGLLLNTHRAHSLFVKP